MMSKREVRRLMDVNFLVLVVCSFMPLLGFV